ncbi:MAG: hypothetical protein D6834_00535 [Aquificota bacterium]|nr:MAG: hypothetical protein D6834_00535 [Aquificota bacterium]
MGKMQRRKGYRVENEIVNYLKKHGIPAKRVPLSGSADGFKGDILIDESLKCEVKARKDGFKQIYDWLEGNDYLFLKANRKKVLVVMEIDEFIELLKTQSAFGVKKNGF